MNKTKKPLQKQWFLLSFLKSQCIYKYKSHLINVRISFVKNYEIALELTDTNNHYPFGFNYIAGVLRISGFGDYYFYKYNGKELHETGMFDYGARMYMPDLGRWSAIDPLAEASRRFTPYHYGNNNPIRFIDPDGRITESFIDGLLKAPSGSTWYNTGNGFSNDRGGSIDNDGNTINWGINYTAMLFQNVGLGPNGIGCGSGPGYGHLLLNVTKTKLVEGKLVPLEYGFKPSVAYLLSLLSGVNYDNIIATAITFKGSGMGALTTGKNSISGTITNFDVDYNNITSFLGLMSHEVGHLPQLDDAGGNLNHLSRSGLGYIKSAIKNRSISYEDYHDKAPLEMAAEKGYDNFKDYNNFVNSQIGQNKLESLFKNKVSTESEKSHVIQIWFKAYINNIYGKNNYK